MLSAIAHCGCLCDRKLISIAPVVFRHDFNNFLFFPAGQDDRRLEQGTELGKFFMNVLIAVGVTVTIWANFFSNFE